MELSICRIFTVVKRFHHNDHNPYKRKICKAHSNAIHNRNLYQFFSPIPELIRMNQKKTHTHYTTAHTKPIFIFSLMFIFGLVLFIIGIFYISSLVLGNEFRLHCIVGSVFLSLFHSPARCY